MEFKEIIEKRGSYIYVSEMKNGKRDFKFRCPSTGSSITKINGGLILHSYGSTQTVLLNDPAYSKSKEYLELLKDTENREKAKERMNVLLNELITKIL